MTHSSGMNAAEQLLQMVNNCNTLMANSTDYAISHAILQTVREGEKISIQELSDRASISPAAISRFIRRMGYSSFEDFKIHFNSSLMEIRLHRQLQHSHQYQDYSRGKIADRIYQETLANLQATYKKMNLVSMEKAIRKMCAAESVTILGDDHTLSDFYTFQLDLLFWGIPACLYKQRNVQQMQTAQLSEKSVILFLNVCTDFISSQEWKMLRQAHEEKHVYMIGLFQESNADVEEVFDDLLLYGIPHTVNDGFYSLTFLSRVFSEILTEILSGR